MTQTGRRTVLITGASSGIGEGLAREHARRGDRVALLARRRERLEALQHTLRAQGAEVSIHTGDVCRDGDVAAVVRELAAAGIGIDIVYANAGFGVAGALQRLTLDDYQRQFDTNVFGMLRTIYETLNPELVVKSQEMEVTSLFAGASILVLLSGGLVSLLWFSRMP